MLRRSPVLVLGMILMVGGCAYRAQQRASGWLVVETEHVRLRTNISRRSAAQIAVEMQRIREVLVGHTFPCAFRGSVRPVPVTVLSPSEYRDFAPRHAAAFYRYSHIGWLPDYEAQIILPDDLGPEALRALQHEMTQHLVASCLPAAPRWLHEGLAKFLETVLVEPEKVTFGSPAYGIVDDIRLRPQPVRYEDQRIMVMPLHMLPSIQRVIATSSNDWQDHEPLDAHAHYAAAWALVHFLELGAPDLHARFQAYLQDLRLPGGDPQALFAKAFAGVPLQERLDAYLRRGAFPKLASRSSAGAARKADVRVRAMHEGEGHLHLAWLWAGVAGEESRGRWSEHLRAAKRHERTRTDAHLLGALILAMIKDLDGAHREVIAGVRGAPGEASLLQAHVSLLIAREVSTAAVRAGAARLRPVARTAGQLCTLARAELAQGDAKAALELAARGLAMEPSSWLCRGVEETARHAPQPGP